MINLEPIPSNIQKRLKQKQNVLGRKTREFDIGESQTSGDIPELSYDMLATRTPFLRMSSGIENQVVLMGGELKRTPEEETDLTLPSGYDEIYGARRLINEGASNELRRPIPGVKSIEAEFLGGNKATRRATINWTCWSFEDIDRLTPHFLQHGHGILVEWGWVYNEANIQNLPNFKEITGFEGDEIKPDVYQNYRDKIIESYGDVDVMAGVISNYEYNTRTDGGFDCQTVITSLGVNLFKGVEKNKEESDNSALIDFSKIANSDNNEDEQAYFTNTNVNFKAFLESIDEYIVDKEAGKMTFDVSYDKPDIPAIHFEEDKFVFQYAFEEIPNTETIDNINNVKIKNVWVRWGWFEDYILSQFITLTNSKNDIVGQFRSVEFDPESGKYESVKVRNHDYLETIDYEAYILPGQFYPLSSRKITDVKDSIPGDDKTIIQLAKIVNENFKPFSTGENDGKASKPLVRQGVDENIIASSKIGGTHGYLRNMLVNTKIIKEAFGNVDYSGNPREKNYKIEPMNMFQGIETLLSTLNTRGGLSMWNLQLQQDSDDTERIKIIDDSVTAIDFTTPDPFTATDQTKFKENSYEIDGQEGIFYFPVWQTDSIVKTQNISARIPSALQIATMYGANFNGQKEPNNVASFHDPAGVIAGGVGGVNNVDKRFVGSDIALRNNVSVLPEKDDEINNLIATNTKLKVNEWLNQREVKSVLAASAKTKQIELTKKEKAAVKAEYHDVIRKNPRLKQAIDSPGLTLQDLNDEELNQLFSDNSLNELFSLLDGNDYDNDGIPNYVDATPGEVKVESQFEKELREGMKLSFEKARKELLAGFSSKYNDSGAMNSEFSSAMKDRITYTGKSRNDNLPILIPLELELEIDGIGGIYPGNAFHSTYLPQRYQDNTVFQIMSVNHSVSETGWTVTLIGKMRSSIAKIYKLDKKPFTQEEVNIDSIRVDFLQKMVEGSEQALDNKKLKDDIKTLITGDYAAPVVSQVNRFFALGRLFKRIF
tara:strand:+ start:599 stop:3592 length:2994 start_codon:yes stop_codon:yes gene_type:complete